MTVLFGNELQSQIMANRTSKCIRHTAGDPNSNNICYAHRSLFYLLIKSSCWMIVYVQTNYNLNLSLELCDKISHGHCVSHTSSTRRSNTCLWVYHMQSKRMATGVFQKSVDILRSLYIIQICIFLSILLQTLTNLIVYWFSELFYTSNKKSHWNKYSPTKILQVKRPFGLYHVAFFPVCNASSSDHPQWSYFDTIKAHSENWRSEYRERGINISL